MKGLFTKEQLKWYRRLTAFQLTLGALAMVFLYWHHQQDKGTYDIINRYPYDASIYTQGLALGEEGQVYVSAGRYGQSALGLLDQGNFQVLHDLEADEFGEDIAKVNNRLWQLTWREGKAYEYDMNQGHVIKEVTYSGKGWGLAYDPNHHVLYHSDGSSIIQVRQADSFEWQDSFTVQTPQGQEVDGINAMAFDGQGLVANVYPTNRIIYIQAGRWNRGRVTHEWDLTDLVNNLKKEAPHINELNGIAHLGGHRFYVGGKNFPYLYEIELH